MARINVNTEHTTINGVMKKTKKKMVRKSKKSVVTKKAKD